MTRLIPAVLAALTFSASGAPLDMELAHVYTMRDGKAASAHEYMDRAEALDAAGLSE